MKKHNILLIGIILISVFLRFYRIEETFLFIGEVGHNLLAIKNGYISRQIPLLGPPTSHPWLSFGPLFYWIYGPVLILSGFNPLSHAYFGAFGGLLIVLANYWFVRKIFTVRAALISTYLLAISPLFLQFSRSGRFFSLVTLFTYPILYLLFKIAKKEKVNYLLFGLFFGVLFSFHFTPLMLIPFFVSAVIANRTYPSIKSLVKIISGFFISMFPFFLYDLQHRFTMTSHVLLWIPYRVAGFFGLYPKNTVSPVVIKENLLSFNDFIVRSFFPFAAPVISYFILIVFTAIIIRKTLSVIKKQSGYTDLFLLLWFFWGFLAVFIHGSPPIHYFVPILPTIIIIVSVFSSDTIDAVKKISEYARVLV